TLRQGGRSMKSTSSPDLRWITEPAGVDARCTTSAATGSAPARSDAVVRAARSLLIFLLLPPVVALCERQNTPVKFPLPPARESGRTSEPGVAPTPQLTETHDEIGDLKTCRGGIGGGRAALPRSPRSDQRRLLRPDQDRRPEGGLHL